jgi:hypothetical protein
METLVNEIYIPSILELYCYNIDYELKSNIELELISDLAEELYDTIHVELSNKLTKIK